MMVPTSAPGVGSCVPFADAILKILCPLIGQKARFIKSAVHVVTKRAAIALFRVVAAASLQALIE